MVILGISLGYRSDGIMAVKVGHGSFEIIDFNTFILENWVLLKPVLEGVSGVALSITAQWQSQ